MNKETANVLVKFTVWKRDVNNATACSEDTDKKVFLGPTIPQKVLKKGTIFQAESGLRDLVHPHV